MKISSHSITQLPQLPFKLANKLQNIAEYLIVQHNILKRIIESGLHCHDNIILLDIYISYYYPLVIPTPEYGDIQKL